MNVPKVAIEEHVNVPELAEDAGLKLGPRKEIAVDRTALTSDEHIYSAGDCADAYHVVTGQKVYIPLALRANRAGWAVADNVTGRPVELPGHLYPQFGMAESGIIIHRQVTVRRVDIPVGGLNKRIDLRGPGIIPAGHSVQLCQGIAQLEKGAAPHTGFPEQVPC